jgi:hypothetical protein
MARTATGSLSRRTLGEGACLQVKDVRLVAPLSDLGAFGRDGQKRDSAEQEACSPEGSPLPMDFRCRASRPAALRFACKLSCVDDMTQAEIRATKTRSVARCRGR